jgi:hypothetical protein
MSRFNWLAFALLAIAPVAGVAQESGAGALVPRGFGSLRQTDLELRLRTDEIELRFVPLDERVLRLIGNDAYQSLVGLIATRRGQIDDIASQYGVSRPGLALVSFFGQRPGARFDPNVVSLVIRNQIVRPIGVVPLSPQFASQQLDVRGAASGILVFDQEIPVTEPFSVSYGGLTNNDWERRLVTLDRERQRVAGRARGAPGDTTQRQ